MQKCSVDRFDCLALSSYAFQIGVTGSLRSRTLATIRPHLSTSNSHAPNFPSHSALFVRLQASQLEEKVQEGQNADAFSLGATIVAQQAMDSVNTGVQQMKDDWVQRRIEEEKLVCRVCQTCVHVCGAHAKRNAVSSRGAPTSCCLKCTTFARSPFEHSHLLSIHPCSLSMRVLRRMSLPAFQQWLPARIK